jgi:four helix bundle protein
LDLGRFNLIEHARQIGDSIWKEVLLWNYFEKDTIGKQLVRASDSISANLSEAYGRYGYADRKRFAYYARGSLCETINWIQITSERNLMKSDLASDLISELDTLSRRINAYINAQK